MIQNILILDTETTGLNADKDKIIEIGVILYNIKHKAILQNYSTLFPCPENPVEHINNISAAHTNLPMPWLLASNILSGMIDYADAIVAHNAQFDKRFTDKLIIGEYLNKKPWICTKNDFNWPFHLTGRRLQDICEAVGVEYKDAHRALSDCSLLAQCFDRTSNLESRFEVAIF